MENNDYNSFTYSDEDEEIRLSSLIKKMMSHTKLMLFTVIIFVILSFVYAYVLYEPAYDASASYTYEIKENSTFTLFDKTNYIDKDNLSYNDKMNLNEEFKKLILELFSTTIPNTIMN